MHNTGKSKFPQCALRLPRHPGREQQLIMVTVVLVSFFHKLAELECPKQEERSKMEREVVEWAAEKGFDLGAKDTSDQALIMDLVQNRETENLITMVQGRFAHAFDEVMRSTGMRFSLHETFYRSPFRFRGRIITGFVVAFEV